MKNAKANQFGRRKATEHISVTSTDKANQSLDRFRSFKDAVGRVAWWSFSAFILALALALITGHIKRIEQPEILFFMQLASSLNLTDTDVNHHNLEMFGLWGLFKWNVALWVFLIWSLALFVGCWVLLKKVSIVAVLTAIAAISALYLTPMLVQQVPYESKTERYLSPEKLEARLLSYKLSNATFKELDKVEILHLWVQDFSKITTPQQQKFRAERAGVSIDRIRQYDSETFERMKFVAAQYLAAIGEQDEALKYLPIEIEKISFHPESAIAFARKLVWLEDEIGASSVAQESVMAQLRSSTGTWERLSQTSGIHRFVILSSLIGCLAALSAYALLWLRILQLKFISARRRFSHEW